MRKAIQILTWILILVYVIVALGFTADKRAERRCTGIKINIPDGEQYRFFDEEDVERIMSGNGMNIKGLPIDEVNTRKIESIFRKSSYVRKVDVFFTVDGTMTIRIRQREPLLRIITSGGSTYYIDREGYILPASRKFSPYVMVGSGDFNMGGQLRETMYLGGVRDSDFYRPWTDALILAKYIENDDFLRSQIVQIYYNSSGNFELIPRVGAHQIIIGDATDLENKFFKLEVLYREGLKREGWNNYQKIDLRFKNQIICTKR